MAHKRARNHGTKWHQKRHQIRRRCAWSSGCQALMIITTVRLTARHLPVSALLIVTLLILRGICWPFVAVGIVGWPRLPTISNQSTHKSPHSETAVFSGFVRHPLLPSAGHPDQCSARTEAGDSPSTRRQSEKPYWSTANGYGWKLDLPNSEWPIRLRKFLSSGISLDAEKFRRLRTTRPYFFGWSSIGALFLPADKERT